MGKHPRSKANQKAASGRPTKLGHAPRHPEGERPQGMQRLGNSGWEQVRQAIRDLTRPAREP